MATFTLKSRNHGEKTFFAPDSGGYVRLEYGRNTGTLGQQICSGGQFFGHTLSATPDSLERVARAWWRQYLARERNQ